MIGFDSRRESTQEMQSISDEFAPQTSQPWSLTVADVHRKSALYRSSFESYRTEQKQKNTHEECFLFLAYPIGFEPTAYRVGVCRSIQLGYG